jgi:hypothetical protein
MGGSKKKKMHIFVVEKIIKFDLMGFGVITKPNPF